MEIKADEITEILKRQLAGYEKSIDVAVRLLLRD